MSVRPQPMTIVGGGLAGPLLGILLARRGFAVTLIERRADPRIHAAESGRSINLALAARGVRGLERAGVLERVQPLLTPMRGRRVHAPGAAEPQLQPYGQRPHELIYSVPRAPLNRLLVEELARCEQASLRFGRTVLAARPAAGVLEIRDEASGRVFEAPLAPTIAADGAGSAVRQSLAAGGQLGSREEFLDHDYKELTVPARAGRHALDPHALHVWPRGGFMLIALPNPDATFTATLFLSRSGTPGFEQLREPGAVEAFFAREFPDARALMPRLAEEFAANPQSPLGTVRCRPWHVGGQVLLLGDAAHAIVPFHGQGMNCAFEDCVVLDELLGRCADWAAAFAEFERLRRPDAEAIAAMALENYVEMRDTVRDARFGHQRELALALERRFPERFIPRYSMVMFHPEIPYAEAQRRGAIQQAILEELEAAPAGSREAGGERARALVEAHLPPIGPPGRPAATSSS